MAIVPTLTHATAAAVQWRLLVVWCVSLLVPTTVFALPLGRFFASVFARSVRADEIARGFDFLAMGDAVSAFEQSAPAVGGAALAGTLITLLLSPFLGGMTVVAARAAGPLRVVALLQAGISEYPRMGRMLLVSILPLGAAAFAGGALLGMSHDHAEKVTLQSSANVTGWLATAAATVLFALAHLTVEAGRAELAAQPSSRSAFKAWLRGAGLVARRPVAALSLYLVPTLLGGLSAFVLVLVRMRLVPASPGAWAIAFVVTQLVVAAVAWGRVSRLFALHDLAGGSSREKP